MKAEYDAPMPPLLLIVATPHHRYRRRRAFVAHYYLPHRPSLPSSRNNDKRKREKKPLFFFVQQNQLGEENHMPCVARARLKFCGPTSVGPGFQFGLSSSLDQADLTLYEVQPCLKPSRVVLTSSLHQQDLINDGFYPINSSSPFRDSRVIHR